MAEDVKRIKKTAKKQNPLLLLLQKGLYRTKKIEYLRQRSADNDVMGPEPDNVHHENTTWVDTVCSALHRRPSCGSSRCLSCSETRDTWSTSYTSWTRPLAQGHRHTATDSCQPPSSILDKVNIFKIILGKGKYFLGQDDIWASERSRKLFRVGSQLYRRRDSSADTSKDIDCIEDLELDDEDDESSEEMHQSEEDSCDIKCVDKEDTCTSSMASLNLESTPG